MPSMPRRHLALPLVLLLAAQPSLAAAADHERARAAQRAGRVLPLEAIVAKVVRDFPGDILGMELEEEHGRVLYEVKTITTDGRIPELEYDAATGALLETKAKRRHGRR